MSGRSASSTEAIAPEIPRIGPNAVLQLVETLRAHGESALAGRVFERAGQGEWLDRPPETMVPQDAVLRVHAALWDLLPLEEARSHAREAGLRTGDYLLAHRIPAPAQRLLRLLPASLAARVLCRAIAAHAWTFVGSGGFACDFRRGLRLTIGHNPLALRHSAEPDCVWHAAVFERLFRTLVHPHTTVREVACTALGDPACVFELRWR
jgi:divinyl protochlorophyllide a 8-vinyl-reductase